MLCDRSWTNWFFFSSLLLVVLSATVSSAANWAPIDPAELQMKDLPEQPGVPVFVLRRQVVDDDSVGYEAVYVRIKVLTEAGRKYGDIEIPYWRDVLDISDIMPGPFTPTVPLWSLRGQQFGIRLFPLPVTNDQ
jgi:hypothetical protein